MKNNQRAVLGVLLCLCFGVKAATFSIGSGAGNSGAMVWIPVSLAGDGQTIDAQMTLGFDETRLDLPVVSGTIPGASTGGDAMCVRIGSNRVGVFRLSMDLTPLPAPAKVLCNLPFMVRGNAPGGMAQLLGSQLECAAASGSVACDVTPGTISVNGGVPPSSGVDAGAPNGVSVLLSSAPGAPSVESVVSGFAEHPDSPPLAALAVEKPLRVLPLLARRAQGDFREALLRNPDQPRARLERYLVVEYPPEADLERALTALREERFVEGAAKLPDVELFAETGKPELPEPVVTGAKGLSGQYHLGQINAPSAWAYAGGWSLLGFVDTGIATNHPDLRSFTGPGSVGGSFVPGGNYLPKFSLDVGLTPVVDTDPDEATPVPVTATDAACDPDGNGLMTPTFVGHGTHTSGLAAANHSYVNGVEGTCKHCGVAMAKMTRHECRFVNGHVAYPIPSYPAITAGLTYLADIGIQVVNMSFGAKTEVTTDICPITDPSEAYYPFCQALTYAANNQIVLVGASGNSRVQIQLPASDPRVVAVGGTDISNALWNDQPTNHGDCDECGSNYTVFPFYPRQELVVAAKDVRSTLYPGMLWNYSCGDLIGDSLNDGIGLCTGTSMSAPIVSGLFGVLRSINPLLPPGDGDPNTPAVGLRDAVTATTDRARAAAPGVDYWNQRLGYGIPHAGLAAERVLGKVRGQQVRNRLTPLFGLYSTANTDYAAVATPQLAHALTFSQSANYQMSGAFIAGAAIPGYPQLPDGTATRALAYVLTTEFTPKPSYPPLIPLYLLDRPGGANRDFMLVASAVHVQTAANAGYQYAGWQGYIYQTCSPEPACIPPGAQRLYRQCNLNTQDCAVFLESQRIAFQNAGYTSAWPAGANTVMGYAYPVTDSDGDGLPNGMEYVIGTHPSDSDSDNDGANDGVEFPLAGVSLSDPCSGPSISCLIPEAYIFDNGFE